MTDRIEPRRRQASPIKPPRISLLIACVLPTLCVVGQDDIQLGTQQLGLDESLGGVPGLFRLNRYNFAQDLRISIRGFGARSSFGIPVRTRL